MRPFGLLRIVFVTGILLLLSCAWSWPLVLHPRSTVVHDTGDPLLVTWILWWTSHTVPLSPAWWNAPAFYPSPGVLAFSENLLSLAPLTAPIIWIAHAPLLAYNVAFLASFVLSGLAAYFLTFVVTRSHAGSFVAAIAFAFAPYRLSHTQHLQLLSSYWMPVAVAALHLFVERPSWRWAILFSAAWVLQALASGYYLFFLSTFAAVWTAWFLPGRVSLPDARKLAIAWLAGAVLLAPILLGYRSIQASYGFRRSPVEMINYSADVLGVFSAAPDSWLWSWLHSSVGSESEQFPGLTLILLVILGWRKTGTVPVSDFRETGTVPVSGLRENVGKSAVLEKRASPFPRGGQSSFWFYLGTAVLMWTLSLGPVPRVGGTAIGIPGPYALLAVLPGFDAIRVVARFWMVAVMCLAVAGSIAVARIRSPRTRTIVMTLATLGLLADAWPRTFRIISVPAMRVTSSSARVRLGLPLHETETETMYGAIAQARPVFNGYSGYAAPQHAALRDLLEHHDDRILARLTAREPIEVIVESAGDANGVWNAFVRRQPGTQLTSAGPDWTAYELPVSNAVAPPVPTGPLLQVAAISTSHNLPDINAVLDNDLDTRWHTQPQSGTETINVDLGSPQHVAAVVLCLGAYAAQYPRGLIVEVSADARTWATVYTGGTALETYDAALRSPREIPLTLPVMRDNVRFLRLRQTGRDPRTGWTIVELRVIG